MAEKWHLHASLSTTKALRRSALQTLWRGRRGGPAGWAAGRVPVAVALPPRSSSAAALLPSAAALLPPLPLRRHSHPTQARHPRPSSDMAHTPSSHRSTYKPRPTATAACGRNYAENLVDILLRPLHAASAPAAHRSPLAVQLLGYGTVVIIYIVF